jgi:primase-polymerase (primpol)-like protein
MIAVEHLPVEIRTSRRAVVWKHERCDGKAKVTKVPYVPVRPWTRASSIDPGTWGTFDQALAVVAAGTADGISIAVGDGLVGVDLDDCRTPANGEITSEALAIVHTLESYTEVSPSGEGLRLFAHGTLPPGGRHKGTIEMYDRAHFLSVTGWHVAGTPATIEERTTSLGVLHARVFGRNEHDERPRREVGPLTVDRDDAGLLERAHAARNGAKFAALWRGDVSGYPSHSEADLALCTQLAFWTGGDAARVDRLFRRSGLWRPKWDMGGAVTYGERTIATAIAGKR